MNGVLKKGYLTKKGHKRRNWKKRWFVLQRTIMRYFESREKDVLKVSPVCVYLPTWVALSASVIVLVGNIIHVHVRRV